MILYCAADPKYFEMYFDLWNLQTSKIYPEIRRHIALYKPTDKAKELCFENNIDYNDITEFFPQEPTRNHYYLMRWLFLPYRYNMNILETQINCLPIKEQELPTKVKGQWRVQREKPHTTTGLGGVSAAIFTPEAARKVVEQAKTMLKNPPESDHEMNMWQINNLEQELVLCEYQIKDKHGIETNLPDHAYWITARTAQAWTHDKKLEALKYLAKYKDRFNITFVFQNPNEKEYTGAIKSAYHVFGEHNIVLLPDTLMKLQPGKDLFTLVTEALTETGFSFLVKKENDKDVLKTKGAIYVNKEGNVVEYEDKPTDRVDYYNSFWCAFAFRKRNFHECINFMEKSTLKQKHTINEITQTPIFGSKVIEVADYIDLGTWPEIRRLLINYEKDNN
jgi:hypothetical protein